MIESKMDQKAAEKDFPKLMIKLYFVSGPSRSTICEKKYVELLIQAMCLESGDDSTGYTATDPSGMVRENMQSKDVNKGLQIMYRKAADVLDAKTIKAAIKNLPRYNYGYRSDEWGMGRSLCSCVAHDGPFLMRDEVLKTIASQAAQGEKP